MGQNSPGIFWLLLPIYYQVLVYRLQELNIRRLIGAGGDRVDSLLRTLLKADDTKLKVAVRVFCCTLILVPSVDKQRT